VISFDFDELVLIADAIRAWMQDSYRSHDEVLDGLELLTKVNRQLTVE